MLPILRKMVSKKKETQAQTPIHPSKVMNDFQDIKTSKVQQETIMKIKDVFGEDNDFCTRELVVFNQAAATVLYLSSITDIESVSREVIKPLTKSNTDDGKKLDSVALKQHLLKKVLYHADVKTETSMTKIIDALLRGRTLLVIDGLEDVFLINTFQTDKRSISQPETEQVVRGPRDGFIENLQSNISLIRSRLPIPDFRVKSMQIGTLTKSTVSICYIEGVVNRALVEDVEERLSKIEIDRILDAGYIEQLIQDNPRSPFPQVKVTERPDVAVGNLVEGRVCILVDGSPYALVAPATFAQFYQTSEDYNERFIMVSIIRLIRVVSLLFSLIMPSLYVAVLSYHPELVPTAFAVAITSGRAGVPFPVVIEVFLMEAAMEILREATIRMPKQVGGALSIVGVLVVGQAAVEAGFVSPITVVVIALTSIASFTTPAYNMAIGFRMLRFPLLILTGVLGFYGLMLGLLFVNNHILSLKSFGVPYFSPMSPLSFSGLKDTVIRAPLNWLIDRPEELHSPNQRRIQPDDSGPTNPLAPENVDHKGGKEE